MIAVTLGDPNGIGPEIALKAIPALNQKTPIVLLGNKSSLTAISQTLNLTVPIKTIESIDTHETGPLINLIEIKPQVPFTISFGTLDSNAGVALVRYVEKATQMAMSKEVSAIVTLPINKEAVRFTMPTFSGHTGYIAELCGVSSSVMLLVSDKLTVSHVSTHCSLVQAIARTKKDRILYVIEQTALALEKIKGKIPTIAVCGLNPHAGEHGAFGNEEDREILPAILAAREKGLKVIGPEAADTVFYRALKSGSDIGAIVAMYHDQGHIPMKTVDFDGGVNISLGLPIIRTSVDHGTAFDIAGKGLARTESFVKAVDFAIILSQMGKL